MEEELVSIKKNLKKWEGDFFQKNNRKPNKDDVAVAPDHIQATYKKYGQLRKKLQNIPSQEIVQKDSPNVLKNDEVWGTHLNKTKPAEKKINTPLEETKNAPCKEQFSAFTANLRHKLFNASFSDKKTKMSPFGPNRTKSNASLEDSFITSPEHSEISKSCSKNHKENSFNAEVESSEESVVNSQVKVGNDPEIQSPIFSQALKLTKKANKSQVVGSQNQDESKRLNYIVTTMQEKKSGKSSKLLHKYGANFKNSVLNIGESCDLKTFEETTSNAEFKTFRNEEIDANYKESNLKEALTTRPFHMFSNENKVCNENVPQSHTTNDEGDSVISNPKSDQVSDVKNSFPLTTNSDTTSCVQNSSQTKTHSFVSHLFSCEEAEFQTIDHAKSKQQKNNFRKTSFSNSSKKVQKRKLQDDIDTSELKTPPVKKRNTLSNLKSPETNEDSNSMQIEVSWRTNSNEEKLMIDLDASLQGKSTSEGEESLFHSKDLKTKPKSKSKATGAAKMTSDNYIRLNMKAKTYRRKGGGKYLSGPAYKRQQWKNKMKARSQSFGAGKCFKCGEEGHWANKCKGQGKKSINVDQILENTVDDTDFPTLSQAFNMSKGIKVKPKEKTTDVASENQCKSGDVESEDEIEVIRSVYEPTPAPPPVEPLYQPDSSGQLMEPTADVYKALSMFGFTSFRPGQKKAIMRVLCGQSTLVVLSTGAGKSLCYQLPALMYAQRSESITLVISPLVSLMEDQVSGLPAGVKGACLHTNMTQGQRDKVIEAVAAGNVHFLLISPEAMAGGRAGGVLPGINKMPPIAFACIDEAHCLSEWSHHFRPSYLRICKILKEKFGVSCILGLTATATMVTACSVAQHLGIHDYQDATIRGSPVPTNLQLSVSREEDKDQALIDLLQGERFSKCDSIIIYCTRREQTDRIATLIRTCMQEMAREHAPFVEDEDSAQDEGTKKKGKGKKKALKRLYAECYHAGMSSHQRKRVQNAFMSGRLWVVVATVAFGMGLDKPDVRAVIHYNLPKSFESYVQEIGRAGRDGSPAQCHLFLDPLKQDMNELKRHIYSNSIDRYIVKKLVKKIFPPCRCKELHDKHYQALQETKTIEETEQVTEPVVRICPGHERAISIQGAVQSLDMKEEGIATLLCYLELNSKHWIEVFQNVYGTCSVQCYGGPRQLQEVAKKCPPVAVAIAKEKQCGVTHSKCSKLDFPVVEISDHMGWESGPVKKELKTLQWNFDPSGERGPVKSGVMVEFSDLCFHLRSVGDLSDDEVDEIVSFLAERMETQEATELFQLHKFYDTLHKVSHKNVWMCSVKVDEERSGKLKESIMEYFEQKPDIDEDNITKLSFSREISLKDSPVVNEKISCDNLDGIRGDIRAFICLYCHEHQLTGRTIARIFHGIPSPCFPAEVWGKVRRFWRCHMTADFNVLRKLATQELVKMR